MSIKEAMAKVASAERAAREAEELAGSDPTSAAKYDALVHTVAAVRARVRAFEARAIAARGAVATAEEELVAAKRGEARLAVVRFDAELASDAAELAAYFRALDEAAVGRVRAHGERLKTARRLAQEAGLAVANRTPWSGCVDVVGQGRGAFWAAVGEALDSIASRAHIDMVEGQRLAAAQAQARRIYTGGK